MKATAVLTRPSHRNDSLAQRLQQHGWDALCLPALQLVSQVDDGRKLPSAADYDLIIFVSSYAAQRYLELMALSGQALYWPSHTRVATVGQASAKPLLDAGWIPADAVLYPAVGKQSQDSEGLWQVLDTILSDLKHVLIVRGQTGREWLGSRFEKAGIIVQRFALYDRLPMTWSAADLQVLTQSLNKPEAVVFLLTSSESTDAICANIWRAGLLQQWAQCRFVVIHERIRTHLQSILEAAKVDVKPVIRVSAPSDEAICQTILLSVSPSKSL